MSVLSLSFCCTRPGLICCRSLYSAITWSSSNDEPKLTICCVCSCGCMLLRRLAMDMMLLLRPVAPRRDAAPARFSGGSAATSRQAASNSASSCSICSQSRIKFPIHHTPDQSLNRTQAFSRCRLQKRPQPDPKARNLARKHHVHPETLLPAGSTPVRGALRTGCLDLPPLRRLTLPDSPQPCCCQRRQLPQSRKAAA